jgi:ribosome-associated protein YbcJ (S4-like RNA binding protein)
MVSRTNIVLTGIPRSGTTLACHLLNKLPDLVALHEPMLPSRYFGLRLGDLIKEVQAFFAEQRKSILRTKQARSRSVSGAIPDNHIGTINKLTGRRESLIDGDTVTIDKPLTEDFCLVIKQPNMFTSILEELTKHFDCYSVIRNPLSVLLSWNSVNMPVTDGHAPAAEAFDKCLSEKLGAERKRHRRQIILLDWYFGRYKALLNQHQILRYEKIIETGGKTLTAISDGAQKLNENLKSKNCNYLYDHSTKTMLADLLIDFEGHYLDFYDKNDILRLI